MKTKKQKLLKRLDKYVQDWSDRGDDMSDWGKLMREVIDLIPEENPPVPEPVSHRVEDEEWEVNEEFGEWIRVKDDALIGNIVCELPHGEESLDFWPQRAKRIVAGQKALKMLERLQKQVPQDDWSYRVVGRDVDEIVDSAK